MEPCSSSRIARARSRGSGAHILLQRLRLRRGAWRWSAAGPSQISTGCSALSCRSPACTAASAAMRGRVHVAPIAREQLADVRAGLQRLAGRHSGLLLEDKGAGLALHFLKARELEHELRAEGGACWQRRWCRNSHCMTVMPSSRSSPQRTPRTAR
jgi:hypothetical protein